MVLEKRALSERQAETLPRTALWQVLRSLHDAADARSLTLLAAQPMPWLRSLVIPVDELDELAARAGLVTRVSKLWPHAEAAVTLARAQGVQLEAR